MITGASSGLGKALAIQCASMGMHIILIALPGSSTASLARNIALQYGVSVQVFEFDLTDSQALHSHLEHITRHYNVNFLVNNAGMGGTSHLVDSTVENIDRIIQLNVRSTAMVTRLMIPYLLKNERSYIMNISSMAAFTPIAYKTVYPATKAFISSFSLGLKEEFAGTGLSVSVVYPGPMMTNSQTSRRIIGQGFKGKMGLLTATAIAKLAVHKTLAGQPAIIPGWMNRVNHLLMSLLPVEWKSRIVSREVKKEIQYA
jgi:short-subunit dehydrogenase